jgi:hypothetical protein
MKLKQTRSKFSYDRITKGCTFFNLTGKNIKSLQLKELVEAQPELEIKKQQN